MGHHGSTPRSVLEAPTFTPRWFVVHGYPNRAERRRRGRALSRDFARPVRLRGRNQPYRKEVTS